MKTTGSIYTYRIVKTNNNTFEYGVMYSGTQNGNRVYSAFNRAINVRRCITHINQP